MQELTGDIWQLADRRADWIVIPTNIGWKTDGKNVMGRGLARQAARRWPELPAIYGEFCRRYGGMTPIMIYTPPNSRWCHRLLLLPVKPLNTEKPHLSWRQTANLDLIRLQVQVLASLADQCPGRILVPTLGCGNGGLDENSVVPLLYTHLTPDRFFHVRLHTHG